MKMELKTRGLTKRYGRKTAVDHLDIALSNGVYGLLGANGAGKTTLMHLLCALQLPTSGEVDVYKRQGCGMAPAGILSSGASITGCC